MQRFFNMDNPLFRVLGRLADLMILNILFLICSIPIVTIGASTTAMFYVTLKIAEDEEGYIARGFFHSFKQNFKQATIIWLICMAFMAILGIDYRIMSLTTPSTFTRVIMVALLATGVLFLVVFSYVFPVLARFDNSIKNTIKNSFLMSIINLPYTLLILLLTVGPVIITALNSYTIWYGLLVWILCGFALCAYAKSLFFKKIFVKYMPAPEESDPDQWEVEMPEGMQAAADQNAAGGNLPPEFTPQQISRSTAESSGTAEGGSAGDASAAPASAAGQEDPYKLNEDVWAAFDAASNLDESEDASSRNPGSDSSGSAASSGYAPVPRFGADGRVISDDLPQ